MLVPIYPGFSNPAAGYSIIVHTGICSLKGSDRSKVYLEPSFHTRIDEFHSQHGSRIMSLAPVEPKKISSLMLLT